MQKFSSIFLGVLLAVSFSFTGCQSGTESEINTGDTVSSAVIESNVPQAEHEVETNQPEQTAGALKITAEGVPVEVRLASDGQYCYEYDKDKYIVTTTINGSAFEIKVAEMKSGVDTGEESNVTVYIPNQSYTLITGISV